MAIVGMLRSIKNVTQELNSIVKSGISGFYVDRQYYKFVLTPLLKPLYKEGTLRGVDNMKKVDYHDHVDIVSYKRDRLKLIPLGVFLSIPFSTFGLPFYFKYLPNLLPRGFSSRETKLQLYRKQLEKKRYNCSVYQSQFNLRNSIEKLISSTGITSIQDITYPMISNLCTSNTLYSQQNFIGKENLKLLSKLLGFSTCLTPNRFLKDYIEFLPQSESIYSDRVLLEIQKNTLTFEDLQDILALKSLEFGNNAFTYSYLLSKAEKYNQLVMEIKQHSENDPNLFIKHFVLLQILILELHL
ncbi:hypothetical protein CYY_002378 [Polysphondylium violaceum]|uniref:Letm1 RBD domain-containing protein n=1 Tax=Polysphondylium violaceum TaxID=133409 RepID=A0A8J4V6Z2_9MYCE|nr:hypothetical protein CYY_002378 [Polysphondylium violaceum]